MYDYTRDYYPIPPTEVILFLLGLGIFQIIGMWKVFEKAGKPGWAAIIPIYNIYVMTQIGGKPGWWTLLCLIPLVNVVFVIWIMNMISKSFGKDEVYTVGLVMLGIIFWPMLGFGTAQYQGPYGKKA